MAFIEIFYWGLGIGDWGLQYPIPNPQSTNKYN